MVSQFEIGEIFAQNSSGITFKGKDLSTGNTVAIRRFFPFGNEGGGLDKEESAAFEAAAKRLSSVEHKSLRSVISASVDPIDHIPFLVTEWVAGDPLNIVIAVETLNTAHIIDILSLVMELSVQISEALGEEAIWIETKIEAILVSTAESNRGFTFCISPFKWLNLGNDHKDLSALIHLTEELTGWKNKLISAQTSHGLGGWLKELKANPSMSLSEAIDSLNTLNSTAEIREEEPGTEKITPQTPTQPKSPAQQLSPPAQKKSNLPQIAICVLLVIIGALVYLYSKKKTPVATAQITTSEPASSDQKQNRKINNGIYFHGDSQQFEELQKDTTIRLCGILKNAYFSQSKKILLLNFFRKPIPQLHQRSNKSLPKTKETRTGKSQFTDRKNSHYNRQTL